MVIVSNGFMARLTQVRTNRVKRKTFRISRKVLQLTRSEIIQIIFERLHELIELFALTGPSLGAVVIFSCNFVPHPFPRFLPPKQN